MSEQEIAPRVPGGSPPAFCTDIARKKINDPTWEPCVWEAVGEPGSDSGAVIVSGGTPRILKRGKRKGKPSWSHLRDRGLKKTVVLVSEERAARAAYETETGNCHNCGGGGRQWAGWSATDGTHYSTCRRCNGSGAAPRPSCSGA